MVAENGGPERPIVRINSLECKACGRCLPACPARCLEMGQALNARGYKFVVYRGSGCVGCGNCYLACPEPLALEIRS